MPPRRPRLNTRLVDLRDLVHQAPSPEGWRAICRALDGWPDHETLGITYLAEHLTAWPEALRAAPLRWLRRALGGRQEPRLGLARVLAISGLTLQPDDAQRLAESPHLAQIRALHLSDNALSAGGLRHLLDSAFGGQLHTLAIRANPHLGDDALRVLADAPRLGALRRLVLSGCGLSAAALHPLPHTAWFGQLDALELSTNRLGPDVARLWSERAGPTALTHLNLHDVRLGDEGAALLGQSTALTRLDALDVSRNQLGDRGVSGLLSGPHAGHLKALHLNSNPLGAEGAAACARASGLARLAHLNLTKTNLGPEGAEALPRGRDWPALERLDLGLNRIGDRAWCALSAEAPWARLQALDVRSNGLGAASVRALARALGDDGAPLDRLELGYNAVGDAGLHHLTERARTRGLRCLAAASNDLTGAGLGALGELERLEELELSDNILSGPLPLSARLGRLRTLRLNQCNLSAPDLERLLEGPARASLERLELSDNPLGAAGLVPLVRRALTPALRALVARTCHLGTPSVEALGDAAHLTRLRELDLSDNTLDDDAARALAQSPNLGSLERLSVPRNRIGDDGAWLLANGAGLRGLSALDVSHNLVRRRGAQALSAADALALDHLDLSGNATDRGPTAPDQLKLFDT